MSNAGLLLGKRKLLHHRKESRKHLLLVEAGEPHAEIKSVSHKSGVIVILSFKIRCR
jgi:hypothetical protein